MSSTKSIESSRVEGVPALDRLSPLLERFRVRARLFHQGPLCGVTRFAAEPGLGFLHVMRRGEMIVTHAARDVAGSGNGARKRIVVAEPALLFYPRPLAHQFHNAPAEGADFVCATLAFDGGAEHPLARALPALTVLPLARLAALEHTLALLFGETESLRCGQRLLADRLFEVLLLQLLRWMLDRGTLDTGLLAGLADARLARALTAVHDRPGDPWSLADMAAAAGMSRSAFAAHFKTVLGETPAEYLARWRLAIAQSELQRGRPLKLLAQELGYANPSALSRLFAQKVGVSPRAWLQASRA